MTQITRIVSITCLGSYSAANYFNFPVEQIRIETAQRLLSIPGTTIADLNSDEIADILTPVRTSEKSGLLWEFSQR